MTLGEFRADTADLPDDIQLQMSDGLPVTGIAVDTVARIVYVVDVDRDNDDET